MMIRVARDIEIEKKKNLRELDARCCGHSISPDGNAADIDSECLVY